ncbi:MAG: alpha/beta hydrolase [Mycobacterium pseudokansasii]|uniref:Monoterpene epsilon-lactone hydrolase n=2 Tax=Mycobacterium pseudokansasii TaxID=2341080 RepID=A0A498QVB8_9MYCO|nr:esterase [Mycobacterium kansasii]MBY0388108.1 alpha/beta hydrolase [Mycobacterium pseudokansasii]VAZ96092.1 Monoterpene epsilon-lactone hydrolase [Mycobacterium pseudokansasii]VAZ97441.1 Monoterpene epsilon-lactone hydrolase [Mycobacterium pseudokansasii]VBA51511.1 Monoterpene epsilon-lactone hydrolase [Mycobacterium pseudokansasii]
MPAMLRVTGRTRQYTTAADARKHITARALRPSAYGPPARLRSDVTVEVARRSGWPIYAVVPKNDAYTHTVVYLHGGAWVNEINSHHWRLVTHIAAGARVKVVVPIYPLIPFGTAAAVVPVVAQLAAEKISPEHGVCLAGDSAGGQIALSAALLLRDEHGVVLPQTVLISPALDISLSNPMIDSVELTDPWLAREALSVFGECWRGDLVAFDPRVSPLAADLTGLGPLTVFSGTRDILNPDARALVQKATAAGVDVDYHERRGLLHVYPLMPIPEGRAAREVIVERLRAH